MATAKKDKKKRVYEAPADRFERMAAEINDTLSTAEQEALKTLSDAGWSVLINPRVENSTTARGLRSYQSKGRFRIGLVKDRIMR
ncbi:MAG: hypothetical protein SWH61_03320 [Thermodesulfobacteriota bacterium]|nr:hypothetical protein [Thermodesulfobacteriota bacterium]